MNNPMTLENPQKIDKDKLPIIKFELMEHDFGTVIEGEKVSFKFKFTNEGKSDLIINNASGSCGCTVPKAPELPIKPGKSEYIEAIFDSSNKEGPVEKTITVHSAFSGISRLADRYNALPPELTATREAGAPLAAVK